MRRGCVRVSDHAILRYLERVGGFDIEGLRAAIAGRLEGAARAGACAVVIDGHVYVIREDAQGPIVVTVAPRRSEFPAHAQAPDPAP